MSQWGDKLVTTMLLLALLGLHLLHHSKPAACAPMTTQAQPSSLDSTIELQDLSPTLPVRPSWKPTHILGYWKDGEWQQFSKWRRLLQMPAPITKYPPPPPPRNSGPPP